MAKTVYLAPYVHRPPPRDVQRSTEDYRMIFERSGYLAYLEKILNSIRNINPNRIYMEGYHAYDIPVLEERTEEIKGLLPNYSLDIMLLRHNFYVEGMEGTRFYGWSVKAVNYRDALRSRIYESTLEAMNNPDAHNIFMFRLKIRSIVMMHRFFGRMISVFAFIRDYQWAQHVQAALKDGETAVMIYGNDHHPERHFRGDIDLKPIYESIREDGNVIASLLGELMTSTITPKLYPELYTRV